MLKGALRISRVFKIGWPGGQLYHLQDLPETDLLLSADYAAHEAGFAATKAVVGGQAALYHIDNTNPDTPAARSLSEEMHVWSMQG